MNAATSLILFLLVLAFVFCQPSPTPALIIEDALPAPEDACPENPIQQEKSARA
jgi:hypothetical protein